MTEHHAGDLSSLLEPSPWLEAWFQRARWMALPPRALDVAMGRGRHARRLEALGWDVIGIDRNLDAVRSARMAPASPSPVLPSSRGRLLALCADLETYPLPTQAFGLIVVSRYLDRPRLPALIDALAPGGLLLYETFTTRQREHRVGPHRADFLLEPGELRRQLRTLWLLDDQESVGPPALAQVAGLKR